MPRSSPQPVQGLLPPQLDPLQYVRIAEQQGPLGPLQLLPPPPRMSPVLNRVIDSVFHPWAEKQPEPVRGAVVYLLDGLAHFLVEMNDQAVVSLWKFTRYNLPKILEKLGVARRER